MPEVNGNGNDIKVVYSAKELLQGIDRKIDDILVKLDLKAERADVIILAARIENVERKQIIQDTKIEQEVGLRRWVWNIAVPTIVSALVTYIVFVIFK